MTMRTGTPAPDQNIANIILALPKVYYWQFHLFTNKGEYVSSDMALDLAKKDARKFGNKLYTRDGVLLYDPRFD